MTPRAYATATLGGFAVLALTLLGLRWQALAERSAAEMNAPAPLLTAGYQPPDGRGKSAPKRSQPSTSEAKGRGVSPSKPPKSRESAEAKPVSELPAPRSINVNTADASELDRLPGIGPVLAQRIIDHRKQHGPFAGIADLTQVSGIGPKKLDAIMVYVRVN